MKPKFVVFYNSQEAGKIREILVERNRKTPLLPWTPLLERHRVRLGHQPNREEQTNLSIQGLYVFKLQSKGWRACMRELDTPEETVTEMMKRDTDPNLTLP